MEAVYRNQHGPNFVAICKDIRSSVEFGLDASVSLSLSRTHTHTLSPPQSLAHIHTISRLSQKY